jgi:hypothetical protein
MPDALQTQLAALTNEQAQLRAAALLHGLSGLLLDPTYGDKVESLRGLLDANNDANNTRCDILNDVERLALRAVVNALEGK